MKSFVERQLVRLLLSRGGPIIQKAVTAAAAAAVAWLAGKLPGIEAHINQEVLIGVLWLAIDTFATKLPADILKTYGTQIQRLLNAYSQGAQLKVDGFVGPVTVAQAASELKR